MIITEIYKGQGLGNQLFCYVLTRTLALDKGYDFGIMHPENFKCLDFLNLDFGKKVIGGIGPEGGPPRTLPEGIKYYYNERKIEHPSGADIRTYDENLISVPDNTKIDGLMQDEQYIAHHRDEIRQWLKVKKEYDCLDYSDENICIINFRGGEYVGLKEVFLTKKYWVDAMVNMRKINSNMQFIVVTDDVKTAKKFFPKFEVYHFSIGKDYSIIKNAYYLILSNSSFAFFPTWLNEKLKFCIAPKYWTRHNVSDGYWSCSYNITSGWMYQDRNGDLQNYESCKKEFEGYKKNHLELFSQVKIKDNFLVVSNYYNDLSWVPEYTDNYVIYDQGNGGTYPPKLDQSKIVRTPALGHNIRQYCTYVINNYDSLPKRIIFATSNIFPRHIGRDYFDKLVNNDHFTPFEDRRRHNPRWPFSFFDKNGGYNERNDDWYDSSLHPRKYFYSYNDFLKFCFKNPVIPKYVRFAPAANYIVPRENILRLPKTFYQNLQTFVSHCSTAVPGEAHIIERAFFTIWTSNYEVNNGMLSLISSDFVAKPRIKSNIIKRIVRSLGDRLWNLYYLLIKVFKKIKSIQYEN